MNLLQSSTIQLPQLSNSTFHTQFNHLRPFPCIPASINSLSTHHPRGYLVKATRKPGTKSTDLLTQIKEIDEEGEEEEDYDDVLDIDGGEVGDEFSPRSRFTERAIGEEEEVDYDKDPEFAEILGDSLDDPAKARSKMEERLRKKRNKILQQKTGSAAPMKVSFNKFEFSDSYIWFEFQYAPLDKDVKLICDTLRSWHIVGRLGGCNCMNMQLSQSSTDKRPSYDPVQGANVNPTTFYNIGDLEFQDNLARVWVDIGTAEPLLLDILINALTQISSDHVGIKQVVFGGSEFENWRGNLTSEDAGYSVHKI